MNGWSAVATYPVLPALYVALLAGGLLAGLRIGYGERVPWRVVVLVAALLAALFAPVLVGDAILLPLDTLRYHIPFEDLRPSDPPAIALQRDLVHQIAPWELEVKRVLRQGGWPLWNEHQGAGMPLLADPQAQAFEPLVLAAYPFSVWTGFGVTGALKVLVSFVFTFVLFRRLDLGEAAAALGASLFAMGGFIMLWLGWPIASCAAFVPVAVYAVVRCADRGCRRDFALLTLALLSLLLGGHPETIVFALVLIGAFVLDRCRLVPARRWWWLTKVALCGAAALCLAAPVLAPTAVYLPTTERAAIVQMALPPLPIGEFASQLLDPVILDRWWTRSVDRLVPIVAPNAFGDQVIRYWGEGNYIQDSAVFCGTLAIALAASGGLGFRRRSRFPHERLSGALLIASGLILVQPPGLDRLTLRLPLIGPTATHQHQRVQLIVGFALAFLAACQFERWRRGEVRRWAVGLGCAIAAGLVLVAYLGNPNPDTGRPWDWRLHWMWIQLGCLLAATLVLLVPRIFGRSERGRARAAGALVGVAAIELLWFFVPANPPNPVRLAYPQVPSVRYLERNAAPSDRIVGAFTALPANFSVVYGLTDVRSDNPATPWAYDLVTQILNQGALEPRFAHLGHSILDLLGVRYVIGQPGAGFEFPRRYMGEDAWIWERPHPLPRLFLPERAQMLRSEDWRRWLNENPDFLLRSLVEPTGDQHRRWHAERPLESRLDLQLLTGTRVAAHGHLAEMRLMASGIYQDGSWRVLANGEALETPKVNGAFVGAWLEAGELQVEALYRPAEFVAGSLMAALALAAAAAWWTGPPRRRVLS
jgi:hypothetical protein